MATGDGTLVPTLSFSSWAKERKSERELGWSFCACRTTEYFFFCIEYSYDVGAKTVRIFLDKILKLFAGSSARFKEVHLNPGLVYIPMLFAGDSLSFGMQPVKCF